MRILLDVGIEPTFCKLPTNVLTVSDDDEVAARAEHLFAQAVETRATAVFTADEEVYEKLKNTGICVHYLTLP